MSSLLLSGQRHATVPITATSAEGQRKADAAGHDCGPDRDGRVVSGPRSFTTNRVARRRLADGENHARLDIHGTTVLENDPGTPPRIGEHRVPYPELCRPVNELIGTAATADEHTALERLENSRLRWKGKH